MHAAQGVLTSRGGLTSHAAVVARGWGKSCVVGAGDVVVDEENRLFRAGRVVVREGQVVTLNGATGEVVLGALPLVDPKLSAEFRELAAAGDITVLDRRGLKAASCGCYQADRESYDAILS